MKIRSLKLEGTYEIELQPIRDDRGYFSRTYDKSIFQEHGLTTDWVQENQSETKQKDTIRGLHFQNPPFAETKLVRVVEGAVLDVFVDLRKGSRSFGQWDSIKLTEDNMKYVYIPRGFAHGFLTLSGVAVVQYKVDSVYSPESDSGIRWNDPDIGIEWSKETVTLSEKDQKLQLFSDFSSPF